MSGWVDIRLSRVVTMCRSGGERKKLGVFVSHIFLIVIKKKQAHITLAIKQKEFLVPEAKNNADVIYIQKDVSRAYSSGNWTNGYLVLRETRKVINSIN